MDILTWLHRQLSDFFGLEPLLKLFAAGDYRALLSVEGFAGLLAPIIPLLLIFELLRGVFLRRTRREDYQVPLLVMVLNRFIGSFLTIAMLRGLPPGGERRRTASPGTRRCCRRR